MENFTFGMYKGRPVKDIIVENPMYVRWCVINVSFFELTVEQAKALEIAMTHTTRQDHWRPKVRKAYDENEMYSEDEPYEGWGEDMRACFDPNY